MKIPNWYVVTGGPSSGKSTTIQELAKLGYKFVPEAARVLIDEYKTKGISADKLRKNEKEFQKKVLQMKLEIEKRTSRDDTIFFDRGIPDSIAYYQVCGLDSRGLKKISRNRYKGVFFLEQLAFKQDYARVEDKSTVNKLNELLLGAYKVAGYNVIIVPIMPVKERAKFIVQRL